MPQALLLAFVLQLLLPVVLIAWLWQRRPATSGQWLVGVVIALGAFVSLALVLPWLDVPWWAGYLYVVIGAAAAIGNWLRLPYATGPVGTGVWRRVRPMIPAALAVFTSGVAGLAVAARQPPEGPLIDLACPLSAGTYLVASGGTRSLVNAHLVTLDPDPRYLAWRGQSYGVDLVQLDRIGMRASAVGSSDPASYRIHGQVILAPCAGVVVNATNNRPEMRVSVRDPDRSKLAGNHVLLACGDVEVLLAHMQEGSVRVATGDWVSTGDELGVVGNSGNTDEPHLHISAQRRLPGQPLIGGDPVWITIEGRFLARNDRLVCGR